MSSIRALSGALILIAGIALALCVGGCGERADEQLALERYLADLRPALEADAEGFETLATAFEAAGSTDPPDLGRASDGCAQALMLWNVARGVVEDARPPADLRKAEESLDRALSLQAGHYREIGDILSEMDTTEDSDRLEELESSLAGIVSKDVLGETAALTEDWERAVGEALARLDLTVPAWYGRWRDTFEAAVAKLERL